MRIIISFNREGRKEGGKEIRIAQSFKMELCINHRFISCKCLELILIHPPNATNHHACLEIFSEGKFISSHDRLVPLIDSSYAQEMNQAFKTALQSSRFILLHFTTLIFEAKEISAH